MESRDVLKIHGALRRYCTSRVSLRSTLEVQYLLNLPCIFNTSLDSMLYSLITYIHHVSYNQLLVNAFFLILSTNIINPHSHPIMHTIVEYIYLLSKYLLHFQNAFKLKY